MVICYSMDMVFCNDKAYKCLMIKSGSSSGEPHGFLRYVALGSARLVSLSNYLFIRWMLARVREWSCPSARIGTIVRLLLLLLLLLGCHRRSAIVLAAKPLVVVILLAQTAVHLCASVRLTNVGDVVIVGIVIHAHGGRAHWLRRHRKWLTGRPIRLLILRLIIWVCVYLANIDQLPEHTVRDVGGQTRILAEVFQDQRLRLVGLALRRPLEQVVCVAAAVQIRV